jgi:hypothetical protein
MGNVVVIPKEKSFDLQYLKNILDEFCASQNNGTHACCSGESLQFRIEEDSLKESMRSPESKEKIYRINNEGKLVSERL